ncbi:Queuine tRNA-ribosyltransferase subunit QTRTD1 like protein [Dufourea novaeangliae]|uniref:Queuine tRNA-ribosyltransferase accessory subunit 2 n=1 Tax=Dufourea novaeangliae TaxID=178035 RepID=A0A154P1D3_DUFNO|nr:Queuine tRNA-ribosyltransferase subunit QTRTD1 like protein [Dufourea novaeangliae]
MKFFTNSAKSVARIGTLTNFERIPTISFETPLALIYTKGGSVPHLTKDVFKMVTTDPQLLSVSLPSTLIMTEAMKEANISFSNFVSMQEHINMLTIHDPADLTPSGHQMLDTIPVWPRSGRIQMSANKYMDLVETFKPDCYVALCDGDTNIDSSKKRSENAVNRSKTLFEQCLSRHTASESLKSTGILGAIEGGYNVDARLASIDYLKDKPVLGYVIDGLHNNGPLVHSITSEQIKQIVEQAVSLLPSEKLKVSMGCWNPPTVLDLIELGIDVFDTSYPYVAVKNAEALTFLCDHNTCGDVLEVISFRDIRYEEDFSPICSHCECLTCKNHTRAYLYHLRNTREMLLDVLLMIHNIHHYLEFFKAIRENIKSGTFDELKQKINLKFENFGILESCKVVVAEELKSSNT